MQCMRYRVARARARSVGFWCARHDFHWSNAAWGSGGKLGEQLLGSPQWELPPPRKADRSYWFNLEVLGASHFDVLMDPFRIPEDVDIAVGVSGGPDSMALCLLAHEWMQQRRRRRRCRGGGASSGGGGNVHAICIDHSLRGEESAFEQALAKQELQARGIPTHLPRLLWTDEERQQGGRLQGLARAKRHACLNETCHALGIRHLLLAHTMNDQVETLLLRFARCSGLHGLAGMQGRVQASASVSFLRPLLPVSKVCLKRTLLLFGNRKPAAPAPAYDAPAPILSSSSDGPKAQTAACVAGVGGGGGAQGLDKWAVDPSNSDLRFARVRVRRFLQSLNGATTHPLGDNSSSTSTSLLPCPLSSSSSSSSPSSSSSSSSSSSACLPDQDSRLKTQDSRPAHSLRSIVASTPTAAFTRFHGSHCDSLPDSSLAESLIGAVEHMENMRCRLDDYLKALLQSAAVLVSPFHYVILNLPLLLGEQASIASLALCRAVAVVSRAPFLPSFSKAQVVWAEVASVCEGAVNASSVGSGDQAAVGSGGKGGGRVGHRLLGAVKRARLLGGCRLQLEWTTCSAVGAAGSSGGLAVHSLLVAPAAAPAPARFRACLANGRGDTGGGGGAVPTAFPANWNTVALTSWYRRQLRALLALAHAGQAGALDQAPSTSGRQWQQWRRRRAGASAKRRLREALCPFYFSLRLPAIVSTEHAGEREAQETRQREQGGGGEEEVRWLVDLPHFRGLLLLLLANTRRQQQRQWQWQKKQAVAAGKGSGKGGGQGGGQDKGQSGGEKLLLRVNPGGTGSVLAQLETPYPQPQWDWRIQEAEE